MAGGIVYVSSGTAFLPQHRGMFFLHILSMAYDCRGFGHNSRALWGHGAALRWASRSVEFKSWIVIHRPALTPGHQHEAERSTRGEVQRLRLAGKIWRGTGNPEDSPYQDATGSNAGLDLTARLALFWRISHRCLGVINLRHLFQRIEHYLIESSFWSLAGGRQSIRGQRPSMRAGALSSLAGVEAPEKQSAVWRGNCENHSKCL